MDYKDIRRRNNRDLVLNIVGTLEMSDKEAEEFKKSIRESKRKWKIQSV
jgi:hypothetical protein